MSEYIINDEQIAENRRLHGKKLLVMPVIVRCRDCVFKAGDGDWCYRIVNEFQIEPDGFCAWGKRKES